MKFIILTAFFIFSSIALTHSQVSYKADNIEAYEAYLKGRSFMDKFDPENAKIAREFFEKAIELDPNYADAYAELVMLIYLMDLKIHLLFLKI